MIRRRNLHLLMGLLLPLMVMRGLLPVGYMPVAESGVVKIALCSDGLQLPASNGDEDNHASSGSNCLFSHAATSAPPPTLISLAAPEFVDLQSTENLSAQQTTRIILRAQSSRGPPAFS